MPIPTPKPDEAHDDFIERCMSDDSMVAEYDDDRQRFAICQSQWNETEKKCFHLQIERRFLAATAQPLLARVEEKPRIEGYAAVFFDAATPGTEYTILEEMRERIMPGAFDRAIREDDVVGLFNHDPNHVLGRVRSGTMRLTVDATGLHYAIEMPATQMARDLVANIRAGNIVGSSFSFIPTKQRFLEEKKEGLLFEIREILEVKLFDLGPVTFAAYDATSVMAHYADTRAMKRAYEQWQKCHWRPSLDMLKKRHRLREAELDLT